MAAGTYLFELVKSWRNPLAYGAFPAPSKMNANAKPKLRLYHGTRNGGYGAYTATWLAT